MDRSVNETGPRLAAMALAFVLAAGLPAAQAQTYVWTERQPAGDANQSWECAAMSADATTLIAGVWAGRLYASAQTGPPHSRR